MTKDSTRVQTRAALEAARSLGLAGEGEAKRLGERLAIEEHGKVRRRRLQRDGYAKLGTVDTVLQNLESTVANEHRRDITVHLQSLAMCPTTGRIGRGQGGRPISRRALVQLAKLMPYSPAYAGQYWASIQPRRRANEFSETVEEHKLYPRKVYNKQLVLRFRTPNGDGEQVYSVVSTRYDRSFGPIQVCQAIRKAVVGTELGEQARCGYNYRGVEYHVSIHLRNKVGPGNATIRIYTCDDTRSSIQVFAEMTLPSGARLTSPDPIARVPHVRTWRGIPIATNLHNALEKASDALEPLANLWQDRRGVPVRDMQAAVHKLCGVPKHKGDKVKGWSALTFKGVAPEDVASRLFNAWDNLRVSKDSPGSSQAGLAWAIADAAVGFAWDKEAHITSLETAAGELLAMSPGTFRRCVGELKDSNKAHVANQELSDELARLRGEADNAFTAAKRARAKGDDLLADELEERGQLTLVKADTIEEQQAV